MKVNCIHNINNFKGYQNIVVNDTKGDIERFTLLSLQLNDEGEKDLTRFRNLMKMRVSKTNSDLDDVMVVAYTRLGHIKYITLDNNLIMDGQQLRELKYNYDTGACSEELFKREETFALKAYTFLADITKRLMNQNRPITQDIKGRVKIFQKACELLKRNNVEDKAAMMYMTDSILSDIPFQKVAGILNKIINRTMQIYFR